MFILFPRVQFEKFFQNKLFPDSAVSYHKVLVAACYLIQLFYLQRGSCFTFNLT